MNRDNTFDLIKYILVSFVILGHCLECGVDGNVVNEKVYTFIYSFHMPAFIMISGYFFKKKTMSEGWRMPVNLLLVTALFQVLYMGDPLGEFVRSGGKFLSINGLVQNVMTFHRPCIWYVMALACWRLMALAIPDKLFESKWQLLILSLVISLLVGFVPLNSQFVFQRTFAFFPYFVLGYKLRQFGWWNKVRKCKVWMLLAIIAIYIAVIAVVPHIPLSMLEQFLSYWDLGTNPIIVMAMRAASYVWQLPLALAMMMQIGRLSCREFMLSEGRATLFYYVYHAYCVYWVHRAVCLYGAPSELPFIVAYFMVVMIVLYWMRQIRFLEVLLNPISLFNHKKS